MNEELELLVESTASTWRERDANGRAVDPEVLSGTVRAVMERLGMA